MRSSALAGFLASAVFVSGSAGFASTFLVGPYLGEHLRHQPSRATLMATVAPIPVDPLAALQIPAASTASGLEGEPPASQKAHRLRNVENTTRAPQSSVSASRATAVTPASDSAVGDTPPVTEEAFAPTAPSMIPASAGGPLIATETTSAMISSKLENGEPVLTLRIAPVVTAAAPAVDRTDPDNAVEPTVMSAPPSEQALATPALAVAPVATPAPARVEPQRAIAIHPREKPALSAPAPESIDPVRRVHTRTPARATTVAAPARHSAPAETPTLPASPDPLNAAFTPSTSPTLDEPTAPASPPPSSSQPASTGGPTPLVMPQ